MKTLFNRFFSAVNKFWKRVQIVSVTIAAIATFIVTESDKFPTIDASIVKIASYIAMIFGTIAFTAQFTIKNKDEK